MCNPLFSFSPFGGDCEFAFSSFIFIHYPALQFATNNFHCAMASLPWLLLLLLLLVQQSDYQLASSAAILAKHHHSNNKGHQLPNRRPPLIQANQTSCDLFVGTWVPDDSYPMYQSSQCPIIDKEFNCQLYGRPDSDYLRYRWKPLNCDIPRFDGLDFLVKMRGKTIMFVGDSLGLNQWQSLVCMVSAAAPKTATQLIQRDPLSTFKFLEYGVSVSFYRAPYLVDIDAVQGKRVLMLDDISKNSNAWRGADILSFNTGHWWVHNGALQGWDYMESGGTYYQNMDRLVALEKGLRTWAKWVDANAMGSRVFFQSISPTHYNQNEWNTRGTSGPSRNCFGETVPVSGSSYPGSYPDQMRVANAVIRDMKSPAYLLDITMLSQLRKDCHPSIYSGDLTPAQRANPDRSADCSHWCLPGLPDTWNQLFYTALLH